MTRYSLSFSFLFNDVYDIWEVFAWYRDCGSCNGQYEQQDWSQQKPVSIFTRHLAVVLRQTFLCRFRLYEAPGNKGVKFLQWKLWSVILPPSLLTRSWPWWTAPCRAAHLWRGPGGRHRWLGTFYLEHRGGQSKTRRMYDSKNNTIFFLTSLKQLSRLQILPAGLKDMFSFK